MEKKWRTMDAIFRPGSVAVIGASDNPDKLGSHVMRSLMEGGYSGRIYPVNPGKNEIMGIKAYSSLSHVPGPVDLSIIVIPAGLVIKTIRECKAKGVKGVVLITAGFKEIEDESGERLQKELAETADRAGIRVIGPNTFGIVNLHLPINASFTPEFSRLAKGGISLVSQSGGMAHLMSFLGMKAQVGFSKIIGLGNRCNVDFGEMVEYLADDDGTKVIAMYLEGIDNPGELIKAAKKITRKKPVVAYKAGLSRKSNEASMAHTGSLAGRHELYEGGFKQAGILTVKSSEELLDTAKALAMCPLPEGSSVAVLSGQAGPGIAACDVCETEGLSLVPFSAATQKRIEELLPPMAIRTNPVDMGPAWYDSGAAKEIVEAAMKDKNIDAVILCVMFASANKASLGALSDLLLRRNASKPVICCISSPAGIWDEEIKALEESGIPNYPTPERAAKTLANLVRFQKIRK